MRLNEKQSFLTLCRMYVLYREAFPVTERKPFSRILKKRKTGGTQMLAIEDDRGAFLGLAFTICYSDMVLIDYFAIHKNRRANGAGTEALRLLLEKYKDRRLVLEIETTKTSKDPGDISHRRKSFYLRNGLKELPFDVNIYGVEMEMLGNGCRMTFAEYREIYEKEYGEFVLPHINPVREW